MKKHILISAILCMVCLLLVSACGQAPTQTDDSSAIPDETAQVEGTADPGSEIDPGAETDPEPEADPESAAVVDVVFTKHEENLQEYAVIDGVDAQGNTCWSYTTSTYEIAQLPSVSPIGMHNDLY